MLNIEFEYRDRYTNGEWRKQSCTMESVAECIEVYGLGIDCEYRIVKAFRYHNDTKVFWLTDEFKVV